MTKIDQILADFQLAAQVIAGIGVVANPAVGTGAALAAKLLAALQAGVQAHEAITGTPLDINKLHEIQPLP